MPTIAVLNTDAGLTGKTLQTLESDQLVTGEKSFARAPNAPFVVQSGSAVVTNLDADTVDGAHYATGTWTPSITGTGGGSGQVYTTQSGFYRKIGTLVFIHGRVTLSTLGTVTTTAAIGGLPFASANTQYSTIHIGYWANMTSSFVYLSGLVNLSSSLIELFGATAAGTGISARVQGDLSNTTDLIFSGCYVSAS